jgi:glycosyltransferase involved in cell wall biosynthesis
MHRGAAVTILIVMPLAEQRGGAELLLRHLMHEGDSLGVCWRVVFLQEGALVAQFRALGVPTTVVRAGSFRQGHRFIATVLRIAATARRERADLIFGWMTSAHLYGSLAALLCGIPSLWYQHGMPSASNRTDRAATMLPARGILTCSQSVAQAQRQLRPARPTRVVYPGVELTRFDPAMLPTLLEARRRLGLPTRGPLIGIVGRLQRWKGMHVLVQAMPAVLRSYPSALCVIVGGEHALEPGYPAYLNDQIAALGLGSRVILAGLQRSVPDWMQAMDIVVHASDREPFGMAIVEAMALGKPVIAGDAGGPTEIITSGVNGLLAPYGDADALAASILQYLNDPELARRMGAAARERALQFSTQSFARSFLSATRGLLPRPAGSC